MNYSWRKMTQAAGKLPSDWDDQGLRLALRLCSSIKEEGTPPELVINADQTGIHLVLMGDKTYHSRGEKQVPGLGKEEKRQMTFIRKLGPCQ
jgi:hypothetical protein